jgi:hypothetical protein
MHSRSIGCRDNGTGGSICLSGHNSRPNMNPRHITVERKSAGPASIVRNFGTLGGSCAHTGSSEVRVHNCKLNA